MPAKRLGELLRIELKKDIEGACFYSVGDKGVIDRRDIHCLPESPITFQGPKSSYCKNLVDSIPEDANALFVTIKDKRRETWWGLYAHVDESKIEDYNIAEGIETRTLSRPA